MIKIKMPNKAFYKKIRSPISVYGRKVSNAEPTANL